MGPLNIARHPEEYKRRIRRAIETGDLECRAPTLRRGDVLFWSSRTVHGAFEPSDPAFSRNSYTAHFIPASTCFVQYQCIPFDIDPVRFNGHAVYRPKDQDRLRNRLVLGVEVTFPAIFRWLKREAMHLAIKRYGGSGARMAAGRLTGAAVETPVECGQQLSIGAL